MQIIIKERTQKLNFEKSYKNCRKNREKEKYLGTSPRYLKLECVFSLESQELSLVFIACFVFVDLICIEA